MNDPSKSDKVKIGQYGESRVGWVKNYQKNQRSFMDFPLQRFGAHSNSKGGVGYTQTYTKSKELDTEIQACSTL